MLTLTRKVGEIIRIGSNVQVVVKEIRRNHVRIGVLAPSDTKIYREEVYQNVLGERANTAELERVSREILEKHGHE